MGSAKESWDNGRMEREAREALRETARTAAQLEKHNAAAVAAAAETILACFENGGTVFFCGNGGSAADASTWRRSSRAAT